jgi:hypothetical protein
MFRANPVVGLSTSSCRHKADWYVVLVSSVIVVGFAF